MSEQQPPPVHHSRFPRLRERLPEILLEAFSVLVAVLLAFAVEEWRDDRELAQRADEARVAIVAEIARNERELAGVQQDLQTTLEALENAAKATREGNPPDGLSLNVEVALLSSAAWKTALATDSSRRLDYAWMLQVSELYELQELYVRAQWQVVQKTATFGSRRDAPVEEVLAEVLGDFRLLNTLYQGLGESYRTTPR
ncbi:MAG: hypothetical protein KDI71_06375 [Xanthomonadales bacterium]|nr:hypothetical protein [Xanthomonadales bacterium]